jgi:serine/threonine-protein kinase
MKICPQCGKEYPDTNTLCPADGTALETTGDPLIGETLAGKYRVEERLSVGGMGAVYRGTHILMDKKVAIKVLRPSLAADEKIVARFSREARAASRLSHPHALSVTDFGEAESGVVFLVMEFLSGRTLKEVIRQEGPLPLARVVEIMRQVGGALEAAHAEGVIHRDLKSDNIMLVNANGADFAKVLDFGIAKIKEPIGGYDPGLTSPDLVVGTPQYMSPEQCSQLSEIDARSDIYSLGVILFEMLAGHLPFTGDSATAIMLKQLQELPPSVLDERKDLPASVGLIVSRALAKRPEDRYQKAGLLVEDLVIAAATGIVQQGIGAQTPGRIVVPIQSGTAPENTTNESEETLVRSRVQAPSGLPARAPIAPATSAAGLNPWRIVIPSLAGLLVVFAVIYAFTRKSEPATNTNQQQGNSSTLSADPNSQPVQPAAPPTGQNEGGIPSGGTTNTNANAAVTPTPIDNPSAANDNKAPANANSNRAKESPSPTPSPREANSNEAPPAPSPKPSPRPTLPPAITPAPSPPSR